MREKAREVAKLLKEARFAVIYTGAGISTAAQIPDYRSQRGIWTLREQGLAMQTSFDFAEVVPTEAHRGVATLAEKGLCKCTTFSLLLSLSWRLTEYYGADSL